ncbi:hypothetical protein TWF281_003713 [Arthrobotrys megalospora]
MGMKKKLDYKDYTVGWAAGPSSELTAARLLLDEEHEDLLPREKDDNKYLLGRMGEHNVVISSAGAGVYGADAAAQMVINMLRTFPKIRFGLFVGVGSGVPRVPDCMDADKDIRLGDIVVGETSGGRGGVIQYNMEKWETDGEFSIESYLDEPPGLLLKAVQRIVLDQDAGLGEIETYIGEAITKAANLPALKGYKFPGPRQDQLFRTDYPHSGGEDCLACNSEMAMRRLKRGSDAPVVHYGLIASANNLVKSARQRDKVRDRWNVSCFETGAAGLMNYFPCLVIRGICGYSDGHKNEIWRPYAAITAASYAKDLLGVIRAKEVKAMPTAAEIIDPSGTIVVEAANIGAGSVSLQEFNQLREALARIEGQLQALISQTGGQRGPSQQNPSSQNPGLQNPRPQYQPPQNSNQQPPDSGIIAYQERIGHFLKSEVDDAIRRDRVAFERGIRALASRIGQTDNYWVPWITEINVFKDAWHITEPKMYNKWMSGSLHRNQWQLRRLDRTLSGQQRYFALCNEFTGWLNHQSPWGGETGECSVEHHLWSLWRVMEYMGIAETEAVEVN